MTHIDNPKNEATMSGRTFTYELMSNEYTAILRTKTSAELPQIGFEIWTDVRDLIRDIARAEHPDWNDLELQRYVAGRMSLGDFDLARPSEEDGEPLSIAYLALVDAHREVNA